ncbi:MULTISPECIES: Imm42 family immunity protein [Snodgrassella]|nr:MULTISPECIES: Imm42 family immunity protein [Snodgrassella]
MEIEMIIGNPLEIAIQLEYVIDYCSPSGFFNFVINDKLIPGKGVDTDLFVVIASLKESVNWYLQNEPKDIGDIKLESMDFSEGAPDNIIFLDCCELSDHGCVFWLGFDGDEERLFYSTDYEKTIQEQRYPKGTIANLINSLPNSFDLKINRINDDITNTEIIS